MPYTNVAKNKDADQLHVDHTAYLLLFSHEQKASFLMMQLICRCTKL